MNKYFNQYGAGLNPDKIWVKYKEKLIEKLKLDYTFLRIEKNPELITKLPKDFIECDISDDRYIYLEWIIQSYINNGILRYEDLLSGTKSALTNFEILKINQIC